MMNEPLVQTTSELEKVLGDVKFVNSVLDFKWRFDYKPFCFQNEIGTNTGWLIWVTFERPDCNTGIIGRGKGREEIIWYNSTVSSVVKTCWLLVELMIRHELMEGFTWQGKRIFNPHNTVSSLAKLQDQ